MRYIGTSGPEVQLSLLRSVLWGGGSFLEIKQPKLEADDWTTSSAEVKNGRNCISSLYALHGVEFDL